jgi:hypothetical protein
MKQIPITASKKDTIPIQGGVKIACSLCAGIGKSRTTNQAYTYVMVIENDPNQERNETRIHPDS